ELAIEVSASGRFLPRTVWKDRIEHARQLFYDDRAFGERSGFQIRVDVVLFHVNVVIFGKSRRAVVESVRRQRSAHEYPFAEAGWQLDFSVRQKDRGHALSLGGTGRRRA